MNALTAAGLALVASAAIAQAEPVTLVDQQMDQVSAGLADVNVNLGVVTPVGIAANLTNALALNVLGLGATAIGVGEAEAGAAGTAVSGCTLCGLLNF